MQSNICCICCETISFAWCTSKRRPCCENKKESGDDEYNEGIVCKSCLYKHVTSILSENGGAGGGRSRISCPMGCGSDLTDVEIRKAIRNHHFSWWKHVFLSTVLDIYSVLLLQFSFHFICFALLLQSTPWYRRTQANLNLYIYNLRQRHIVTASQRDVIRQYEQWSVRTALATRPSAAKEIEDVIHCPAPDCPNLWLLSHRFRQHKLANEPSSSSGQPSSPKRSLTERYKSWRQSVVVATANLFYQPPKPEDELAFYEGSNPSELLFWVDAVDLKGNFVAHKPSNDGRKLTCSLCSAEFCGLCRRPWIAMKITERKQPTSMVSSVLQSATTTTKRISHEGKPCETFVLKTQTANKEDESYTFAAQAMQARCCPGCSMRTQRIAGCNHMICPCGTEWCYVCECKWNTFHYSCRLATETDSNSSAAINRGCIVS